jgi:putative ATPase
MDLFQNSTSKPNNSTDTDIGNHQEPLATRMRHNSLKDFAGQKHLVGEGKMLYRMIEKGVIGSMIFYGPPSSGKTTLAHVISALIKSIRGSDPDAALYWISAILEAGEDPNFIFRRLLILASEDIGLAEPNAITIVNSCHEAYMKCGMPEGVYFISHACMYLSLCPKSNSLGGIFSAGKEIKQKGIKDIPDYLKEKTANKLKSRYLDIENASDEYKYPHSYPKNWINQQYLPNEVKEISFYKPGSEGREGLLNKRLDAIKNQK